MIRIIILTLFYLIVLGCAGKNDSLGQYIEIRKGSNILKFKSNSNANEIFIKSIFLTDSLNLDRSFKQFELNIPINSGDSIDLKSKFGMIIPYGITSILITCRNQKTYKSMIFQNSQLDTFNITENIKLRGLQY